MIIPGTGKQETFFRVHSSFFLFGEMQDHPTGHYVTLNIWIIMACYKVNSIDYLLKPIKAEELSCALEKFKRWTREDVIKYLKQLNQFSPAIKYKDKILVPVKDKLQPVSLSEISCFYTTDKNTRIYLKNGKSYPYSKTLEQIEITLNPADFIRANKQFILARDSVKDITIRFDNRLLITLDIEPPERIYISKNKGAEFKAGIVSGKD